MTARPKVGRSVTVDEIRRQSQANRFLDPPGEGMAVTTIIYSNINKLI